jgi:hypothetical protein
MSAIDGLLSLLLILVLGLLAGLLFIGLMRPLRRNLSYRRLRRRLKRGELRPVLIEPCPLPQRREPATGERPSSS